MEHVCLHYNALETAFEQVKAFCFLFNKRVSYFDFEIFFYCFLG